MASTHEDEDGPDDGSRSVKRRRIALACIECRERKRKCDGAKPICGACLKRKPTPDCVYTDENLKRGSSSYVDSLRARIRELEALVNRQPAVLSDRAQDVASRQMAAITTAPTPASGTNSIPQKPAHTGLAGADDHDEEAWTGPDGMGPQGGTPPPESDNAHHSDMTYFGPSSVFGFMRQAQQTSSGPPDELQSFVVSIPVHRRSGQARIQDLIEKVPISLPSRAEAGALVEGYFTGVHSLYPFLHRQSFESRYSKVWTGNSNGQPRLDPDDRIFYSLLNAVFALGVHFTSSIVPQERARHSELYFSRAMGMLNFGVLAQGSIELVQTLLLLGQHLQSTDMPGLCWNIIGLAIRVAQSIGLHIPRHTTSSQDRSTILVNELRKRLWCGCLTLDRVMAMIYGRPLMIATNLTTDIALPSLDDEELDHGEHSSGIPLKNAKISIYVHSLRLILLLGEILESFYNGPANTSSSSGRGSDNGVSVDQTRLRILLNFDAALVSLQKSWPDNLQIGHGGASPFSSRQGLTLRARFLHMRIFLLRPFMLVLHRIHRANGSHNPESSVEEMVAKNTLDQVTGTCLMATEELIDLIWERTMNATNDLSFAWSWWYNVFYIYTCATVIHVARLFRPDELGRPNDQALRNSRNKCMQCLEKYEPFGAAARRARKALVLLEKQINTGRERRNPEASETRYMQGPDPANAYKSPASQQFHISPGGEWDFLASWDSMQFDTSFGLANDPMKWSGGNLNDYVGAEAFMPGYQQAYMPTNPHAMHPTY